MIKLMAVLAMVAHITFPANDRREEKQIRRVNAVKIESGWEMLTDKATIKLPRQNRFPQVDTIIKKGDEVIIRLGYNGIYNEEFTGYVAKVSPGPPVEIRCEDNMWKLKQTPINFASKNTKLGDMLARVIPSDFTVDAYDVEIGAVSFPRSKYSSVAAMLQKLKDDWNLYSFFRGDTLYCGKTALENAPEVEYLFEGLKFNTVEHDLTFRSPEDLRIKVRATSTLTNGNKLEAVVGDEDGEEQSLSYFNITSKSELKKLAMLDFDRLKRGGFDGTLTSYGFPFVQHGYKGKLNSTVYPERTGRYAVDYLETTFDDSPAFRRVLKIGGEA